MRRYGLAALVGAMMIGAAPIAWAQSAPPPAQPPSPPPAAATHTPGDPWERLNRFNYAIEGALDRHLIIPITHIYAAITPGPIGRGIHNVLVNLSEPTVFFNDVLQGRIKQAEVTAGRFVTNSTIGVAGLIDVAGKWGMPHHNNEFGVTLGHWGVHPGPYMYLPIGGPTTLRDLVGAGADLLMDPFHWARFASQGEINGVRLVVGGLDLREAVEGQLNSLLSDATDPYATLRSAPTPAPTGPTAANLFPDASSEIQPDAQQKAVDDAAALKLMSQPYGLASADLDRAAQLGQTLGGVRALEKSLANGTVAPAGPSQDPETAPADSVDLTLAALK